MAKILRLDTCACELVLDPGGEELKAAFQDCCDAHTGWTAHQVWGENRTKNVALGIATETAPDTLLLWSIEPERVITITAPEAAEEMKQAIRDGLAAQSPMVVATHTLDLSAVVVA